MTERLDARPAARLAELAEVARAEALPCALVDLDAFDRNVGALAGRSRLPLRVGSKSVRVPALLKRALGAPGYRGVLGYSALEAARLAEAGFDDVVVAYPTTQPAALAALAAQVARGARLVAMVDDVAHLGPLSRAATAAGARLPVCIDLDLGLDLPGVRFGVCRSPIATPAQAVALYRALPPELALVGVMGYEAQIAGLGDAVPGQGARNAAIRWAKSWAVPRIAARRGAIVSALREAGADLVFVNGGGTGSVESTSADPSVTEVAAGSGLLASRLFDFHRSFRHEPAAFFALEVCRTGPGWATCQGGGYVASGSAGSQTLPVPVWPPGLRLGAAEGAGEVQTPVFGERLPATGDVVLFRPAKAGEWLEHFDEVGLVSGRAIVERARTYRGHGWRFY